VAPPPAPRRRRRWRPARRDGGGPARRHWPGDPTLRAIAFGARLADHWPIVEATWLEGSPRAHVDRVSGDTSGFLRRDPSGRGGDSRRRPQAGRGAPWTPCWAATSGRGSVGSSLGGRRPGRQPDPSHPLRPADGAVTLHHLSIEFDLTSTRSWRSTPRSARRPGRPRAEPVRRPRPRGEAMWRRPGREPAGGDGTISGTADLGGWCCPPGRYAAGRELAAEGRRQRAPLAWRAHPTRHLRQALPAGVPDVALSPWTSPSPRPPARSRSAPARRGPGTSRWASPLQRDHLT
jgi:hypothetical protein